MLKSGKNWIGIDNYNIRIVKWRTRNIDYRLRVILNFTLKVDYLKSRWFWIEYDSKRFCFE